MKKMKNKNVSKIDFLVKTRTHFVEAKSF